MVKFFLFFLLFLQLLHGQEVYYDENVTKEDPLQEKIKSFVSPAVYEQNRGFIEVVFEPKSAYYRNERVDALKVAKTLKENGLLNLFFQEPKTFTLHFKTSGSPVFFVKIMGDTLRSMGYFRYMTTDSTLDASEFVWSIALRSEYATDPLILQKQLQKSGALIVDIERKSALEWSYSIDISHAQLHVVKLQPDEELQLRHSLYAQWLNVSSVKRVEVKSSARNRWYPYIALYDASLHLVKLVKRDAVTKKLLLELPKNTHYMKLSDLYTLKNVRDSLTLYPSGER
jgi:hypothetical protein